MATLTYERNNAATTGSPTWTPWNVRIVFSGAADNPATPIPTTDWPLGTHSTDGDPGTADPGGPNSGNSNNVQWLTSTTMSLNGAASQAINDTNLVEGACTFRLHLNNAVAVETQNTVFFCFDGSVEANPGVGIEANAFERGVSATAWKLINDASAGTGGNNPTDRLDLGEKTSATDSYWYLALSSRPETAGPKNSFDFRCKTEVF